MAGRRTRPILGLQLLVALSIVASPARAPWQRKVVSGKSDSFDTPLPHPLAYFTRDPFLRDDGDDFCSACTPHDKAAQHTKHKFKTELQKVGEVRGFAIYDLFYFFDDHVQSGDIDWKSILVADSSGEFREIYHLQPPIQTKIEPAFLFNAGGDELLGTRDSVPGTGDQYYEDYWWFDADHPVRIDTAPVNEALKSILPDGFGVWKGGGLDMKALRFRNTVWKPDDANCCPSGGTVEIQFRLDRGRVIVTGKHFDPSPKASE
jgi:hypothetical protein